MVEIKLDTAAVESLFPEGEQARVDLQQAVINNIVKRIIERTVSKSARDEITTTVKVECGMTNYSDLVKKELMTYLTSNGWGTFTTSEVTTQKIREAVKSKVKDIADDYITTVIKDTLDKAMENIYKSVDYRVGVALSQVEDVIAKRLNSSFNAILDKAIVERLGITK